MTVRNVFAEGSTSDQYRENWPPLGLAYETFDDIDKHENVCVVQEQQHNIMSQKNDEESQRKEAKLYTKWHDSKYII